MEQRIYVNRNCYLYYIKNIKYIESQYRYLLFNSEKNYWIPVDEISAEIFGKLKENKTIENVCEFFCEKYGITQSIFYNDTKDFFALLNNRGFISEEEQEKNFIDSIKVESNMHDIKLYPFNEIYISLTDECNLDCIYCFNKEKRKKRSSNKTTKKLDTAKIKEIIKEFKELNGKDVVFTGGEPTLNHSLVELCEYVHELDMHPRFITNGLLLHNINLEKLLTVVDEFGVSFDCVDDEILKILWGVKQDGLSKSILNNFQMIDKICKKLNKTISIKIMPIVSRLNADKIDDLVLELADKYENIEFHWDLTKYDKIGKDVDNVLEVTKEEYIDYVIDALKSLTSDKGKLVKYAYSFDNKLSPSHEQRIITCAPSFFIANDGSAYPCQGCEREEMYLGNVWDNSLVDLFKTDIFKKVRDNIIKTSSEKCKSCELLLCCSMVERPCLCWETDNCKEDCIERMFIDAIVN